ncbi:MAG: hypothetical protein LV479_02185 [Methylacidiphilales bacterium]|nr:hypothetical protein [Candidatus Methylacidiphilales bacterium]
MKSLFSGITLAVLAAGLVSCAPLSQRALLDNPPLPLVFQDSARQTLFYVESDRNHVSAIRNGKLLWIRDMSAELEKLRHVRPSIIGIGGDGHWQNQDWGFVSFDTGDFGRFKMSNGDFMWGGED